MDTQVETAHARPAAHPRELIGLGVALFVAAMGANAFVQFVVGYLVAVEGWAAGQAALLLILAFLLMPVARLTYGRLEQRLGDYGLLVLGNALFVIFVALLGWGRGPWIILPAALALSFAGVLVFTAGPLRVLALTPVAQRSTVSGLFFASNFLAWFVAVSVQGQVARLYGPAPMLPVALAPTLVGLALVLALPRHNRLAGAAPPLAAYLRPWHSPRYRLVMAFMALSAVAFGLMFGALAQALSASYGAGLTALALAGFYLARLPGSLSAGLLIRRWGERRVLAAAFGAAGLCLLATGVAPPVYALLLLTILVLGMQQAAVPVAAMALVGTADADDDRQVGFSLLFAAAELGVALALTLGQLLGDQLGNPSRICVLFGSLFLLGSLVAWRLRPAAPGA